MRLGGPMSFYHCLVIIIYYLITLLFNHLSNHTRFLLYIVVDIVITFNLNLHLFSSFNFWPTQGCCVHLG